MQVSLRDKHACIWTIFLSSSAEPEKTCSHDDGTELVRDSLFFFLFFKCIYGVGFRLVEMSWDRLDDSVLAHFEDSLEHPNTFDVSSIVYGKSKIGKERVLLEVPDRRTGRVDRYCSFMDRHSFVIAIESYYCVTSDQADLPRALIAHATEYVDSVTRDYTKIEKPLTKTGESETLHARALLHGEDVHTIQAVHRIKACEIV
jgi:hypothetical protein